MSLDYYKTFLISIPLHSTFALSVRFCLKLIDQPNQCYLYVPIQKNLYVMRHKLQRGTK